MERASGVLMPVSSLPGPYGIGGFGWNAYDFVDFLASCKQHYWQILPLTTTSYGDSPYQSFSARAGNPNFIDFAELIEAGYLEQRDIDGVYLGSDPSNVDYGAIFGGRRQILDRAAERFGIPARDILVELGRKKMIGGQEDMILDTAMTLAKARGLYRDASV